MNQKDFKGTWEITETEMWEKVDLDITETAYIHFNDDSGKFHFICVDGQMDIEYCEHRVEFSWCGNDEGDMVNGRGWVILEGAILRGKIYFHMGDNSTFTAKKSNNV